MASTETDFALDSTQCELIECLPGKVSGSLLCAEHASYLTPLLVASTLEKALRSFPKDSLHYQWRRFNVSSSLPILGATSGKREGVAR